MSEVPAYKERCQKILPKELNKVFPFRMWRNILPESAQYKSKLN
jgi:hypothetical protein